MYRWAKKHWVISETSHERIYDSENYGLDSNWTYFTTTNEMMDTPPENGWMDGKTQTALPKMRVINTTTAATSSSNHFCLPLFLWLMPPPPSPRH
jgi:hypothetical protein